MNLEKLAKRYRSLWLGELASSILFIAIYLNLALRDGQWSRWVLRGYSLAVVVFILIQGIFWWRWKGHVLRHNSREMPPHVVARYRRLRGLNWLLIAGFVPVVLLKAFFLGELAFDRDFWYGLLIMGGAVLEHINYYYYQLMYDNPYDWKHLRRERRLRRGTVAKVLERQHSEVEAP
jgi:hypothetical protein